MNCVVESVFVLVIGCGRQLEKCGWAVPFRQNYWSCHGCRLLRIQRVLFLCWIECWQLLVIWEKPSEVWLRAIEELKRRRKVLKAYKSASSPAVWLGAHHPNALSWCVCYRWGLIKICICYSPVFPVLQTLCTAYGGESEGEERNACNERTCFSAFRRKNILAFLRQQSSTANLRWSSILLNHTWAYRNTHCATNRSRGYSLEKTSKWNP